MICLLLLCCLGVLCRQVLSGQERTDMVSSGQDSEDQTKAEERVSVDEAETRDPGNADKTNTEAANNTDEVTAEVANNTDEVTAEIANNTDEVTAEVSDRTGMPGESGEEAVLQPEGSSGIVPSETTGDLFELPINGASGYASVCLAVRNGAGEEICELDPGEAFTILSRQGDSFLIEYGDSMSGFVQAAPVMVNLPDLIPSIIYMDSNSVSSLFRSSGHVLPEITGQALYDVYFDNARFGEKQFVMPVLYPMAKKIMLAQHLALQQGDSLIIYETFRPLDVQKQVGEALSRLAETYSEVNRGLNTPPWNQTWFIASPLSNHQRGCAIDVSIVRVISTQSRQTGNFPYFVVSEYAEYEMPTPMHELSIQAAAFQTPVSSRNDLSWRKAQLSPGMTPGAIQLQDYCTAAGMSPLASEWWHFNDLAALMETTDHPGSGMFRLQECVSRTPEAQALPDAPAAQAGQPEMPTR